MSSPLAYGLDFGTTNTAIAAAFRDREELVPLAGQEVMPSVTYLHRQGPKIAGSDGIGQFLTTGSYWTRCGECDRVDIIHGVPHTACEQHVLGGGCQDSRLITGVKAELTIDREATHSWGEDHSFASIVSVILRDAKRMADRQVGANVKRAVIGFPVAFPGAVGSDFEMLQRRAMDRLEEAAVSSGFEEIRFLQEPAAALLGEVPSGTIVAVDFGGGTFDVAVLRGDYDDAEIVALRGATVGGERIDAAIFDAKVAPEVGLPPPESSELRRELRTLNGALNVFRIPRLREELRDRSSGTSRAGFQFMERLVRGGFALDLYRSIEQAKIDLSTAESSRISLHRPGIRLEAKLNRSEYEEIAAPLLAPVEGALDAALQQAGITADQVDKVTRTGGASAMPPFLERLYRRFPSDRVETRPALSAIATGLAAHARGEWT